jgi:amicyanin
MKAAGAIAALALLAIIAGVALFVTREESHQEPTVASSPTPSPSAVISVASSTPSTASPAGTAASPTASASPVVAATPVAIRIANSAFATTNLTVKVGTTVTWTNDDSVRHNVVSSVEGGPDGPLLAKGESYSFTFSKAGTFPYICQPHPFMKGTVVVQ